MMRPRTILLAAQERAWRGRRTRHHQAPPDSVPPDPSSKPLREGQYVPSATRPRRALQPTTSCAPHPTNASHRPRNAQPPPMPEKCSHHATRHHAPLAHLLAHLSHLSHVPRRPVRCISPPLQARGAIRIHCARGAAAGARQPAPRVCTPESARLSSARLSARCTPESPLHA